MTQHICPDCKNVFLQPFRCTTCGAQKLYDATLRRAEQRTERAEADLAAARADAERYRKLRSSAYKIYLFHNGEHYTVELPSPGYFPPSEFDAAIDRMLAGKDAT